MSRPERYSFATYIVRGKTKSILIRRNGRRCWYVAFSDRPFIAGFFSMKVTRLKDAVELAKDMLNGA